MTPESQSSIASSQITFEDLTDNDKQTIFNWAATRYPTLFIKDRIMDTFKQYAKNDFNLEFEWKPEIVDPMFRIQSIGSMLHSNIPYIFNHTNLLKKISGQKLLISGIDMQDKEGFIGKTSHHLKQRLFNNNDYNDYNECPLCSYRYKEGDEEKKQMDENDDENGYNNSFCDQCCDSQFGIYTVWTALDYFDTPFNSGSIVFCIGSHNKYKGYYDALMDSESVPRGYSNKSIVEKRNLRWGYVNDIKPGDQFIFNVKTLHAASEAKDGFLRPRIDMRVAIRPSMKRYIKELNEAKLLQDNKENESLNEKEKRKVSSTSQWNWNNTALADLSEDLMSASDIKQLLLTRGEKKENLKGKKRDAIEFLKEKYDVELKQPLEDLSIKELLCELRLRQLDDTPAERMILIQRLRDGIPSRINVPNNYICISCNKVGEHWIMDCVNLKKNDDDEIQNITDHTIEPLSIPLITNFYKGLIVNIRIGEEVDRVWAIGTVCRVKEDKVKFASF